MLKWAAHGLLRKLGLRAMRAHTLDAADAHTRTLDHRVAELRAEADALRGERDRARAETDDRQKHLGYARADLRDRDAQLARLREQAADLARRVTVERDARLAALEQLEQVRAVTRPTPSVHPAAAVDSQYDARHWTRLGTEAEQAGDADAAIGHYARAMQLIHRFGPAKQRLADLARGFAHRADDHLKAGRAAEAKRALVRAVELDPTHGPARDRLAAVLADTSPGYDLTKQCWVYHDAERGKAVYREAFLRAAEYVAGAGLVGEFFEFGVLGGFTARLQCELIRDLNLWRQVHLFDSFAGLPAYESVVDQSGYDTAVRNVWADPMCFGDDFVRENLGCPVDVSIFRRLSEVLSPERVFVYRGFFNETLARIPAGAKAALVHIDCDLYQSTREVFAALFEKDVFQDGCVLLFDDYNCFRGNPAFGERRAFREFLEGQTRYTASPLYTYGWNGAAFLLHDTTVGAGL